MVHVQHVRAVRYNATNASRENRMVAATTHGSEKSNMTMLSEEVIFVRFALICVTMASYFFSRYINLHAPTDA